MRPLAALACLVLACCGGASSREPVVRVVLVPALVGDARGWTSWDGVGGDVRVEVVDGLPVDERRQVVAHELWHAATRRADHLADPRCAGAGWNCVGWEPCDEEAALVVAEGRVRVTCDPALRAEVEWAAGWWNRGVGVEVFATE